MGIEASHVGKCGEVVVCRGFRLFPFFPIKRSPHLLSLYAVLSRPAFITLAFLLPLTSATTVYSDNLREPKTAPGPGIKQANGTSPARRLAPPPAWLGADKGPPLRVEHTPGRLLLSVNEYLFDFASRLHHHYSVQFQYPLRYARRDPTRFVVGLAGITSLVLTDHRTTEVLAPTPSLEEHGLIEPAAKLSEWGNTSSAFPLVLGFGAVGLIFDSPRERETSLMLVEALLTSGTWTELIKNLGGRERPRETEEEISDWEGPDIFNDDEGRRLRSFPSGHATGIWAAATILANQYPKYKIVPVLGYGTAIAISYSRMVLDAHWFSDVLVGGLIGHGCAKQVLSAHESGKVPVADHRFRFGVDVREDYQGISMRFGF